MIDDDRQIWSAMLAHLRTSEPGVCRQWFDEIEPLGISGGILRLRVRSDVHRDYLHRLCLQQFTDAACAMSGLLLTVAFLGPEDTVAPARVENRHHHIELALNPDYGFEHFIVGPENRLAHAAALAVADNPGTTYNPFFVHGDVGLGKTHLLQAICLAIKEGAPGTRLHYTSCEGFMTRFMEAVQAGEMSEFRHRFRDVDLLVIDDIHFLAKRDRTQEEFFHTFNNLYQADKQIILSSDAPPEEIPDLEERLVSRFKWGLVTPVSSPGYETRVEILKNKGKLRGLDLPDDVACWVAARIERNIRELEGAIVKIQIVASVEGNDIDLGLAQRALGMESEPTGREVQIQSIIDTVTEFYGVKSTDLQSKRRHRSIALPRQICMYLARKHTRYSLQEIGGYFGGRDHTTVMHAIRMTEKKSEAEPDFEATLRSLEDRLLAEQRV